MRSIHSLVSVTALTLCVCALPLLASCSGGKAQSGAKTLSQAAASPSPSPAAPAFTPIKADKPTETIQFPSADGVSITADVYLPYPTTAPFIVLCHRAEWSRGEYAAIAPKLAELGFNSMAIDQRSGKAVNGVENATNKAAVQAKKPVEYTDAIQDIQSAIDYAKAKYATGTLILWGSSYSASLSIHLAKVNQGKIDALLAFSPGEYFASMGKPEPWIADEASALTIPVFFTSTASEVGAVSAIFNKIPSTVKTYYQPSSEGKHGSEALFPTVDTSYWVWKAVGQFLAPLAIKR